jgi:hypothetical protein
VLGLLAPLAAPAAPVTWQGWSFDYVVSANEGLRLRDLTFQGRTLIASISFPVMRVFYADDECGPFVDRLGGTVYPITWANNALLAQREFTLNGKLWYEIGIRDFIGDYDMYQVYYLSADGTIDAHIYSRGLECNVDHVHYPNWRIDLDLDGETDDQILRDAGNGFEVLTTEFNAPADAAVNHAWRVRDATTGFYVDVLPGFADFSIPDGSALFPVAGYENHTVFGRLFRATENAGWTFGPNTQVPFNNGEDIDGEDLVLWYEGYLPHTAAEGPALWHSTGVRLVTNLVPPLTDTDADGVPDVTDNCQQSANTDQRDTNGDSYGNACDPDFNNNGIVDSQDGALLRARFGSTTHPDQDLNGNGIVDSQDGALLRARFGQAPGPSGLVP